LFTAAAECGATIVRAKQGERAPYTHNLTREPGSSSGGGDRNTGGKTQTFELVHADLLDAESWHPVIAGCTQVIHTINRLYSYYMAAPR
jgi:hypothetical protein